VSYQEDRGSGWVIFAGVLLLTLGVFNMIDGIAAISKAHFYVNNQRYVFGDLSAWGWVALCLGVLQLLVGFGVFAKNQAARWTGIVLLVLSAIASLLYMPEYPFWSLCIFAIEVLAIYALAAYGDRIGG
jgi:uncharacterized membrane protein HdeD (DUF308 family)